MSPERLIVVDEQVLADLRHWIRTEPRIALRIVELIEHTARDPFAASGSRSPLNIDVGTTGRGGLHRNIGSCISSEPTGCCSSRRVTTTDRR